MLNQKYSSIYSSISGEMSALLGNCDRGEHQIQTSKGWKFCSVSSRSLYSIFKHNY